MPVPQARVHECADLARERDDLAGRVKRMEVEVSTALAELHETHIDKAWQPRPRSSCLPSCVEACP